MDIHACIHAYKSLPAQSHTGRPSDDRASLSQGTRRKIYWWADARAGGREGKWVIGRFFVYVFFPSYYIEGNLPVQVVFRICTFPSYIGWLQHHLLAVVFSFSFLIYFSFDIYTPQRYTIIVPREQRQANEPQGSQASHMTYMVAALCKSEEISCVALDRQGREEGLS